MNRNAPSRDFVPLDALLGNSKVHGYWQSFQEIQQIDKIAETENFSEQGVELSDESRRRFLSLLAGSLALAGLTGCTRQPTEVILPYVNPPENVIPGKAKYYATAFPENGFAQGVIVESHLGRPTKVEGNPDHPASLGATGVHAQACLMDLYDPDRAKELTYLGDVRTWEAFQIAWTAAAAGFSNSNGSRFRLLTETIVSPAFADRIEALLKAYPGAKWHQYDPAGRHSERAAAQLLFGRPINTYYRLQDADVVVSLDADFLACGVNSTRYAHDFANRRRQGARLDMNRLYVVESTMTATGGKADHRLAVRYAEVETFARTLADEIRGIPGGTAAPHAPLLRVMAQELKSHPRSSVVIPGEHQTPGVHALAHVINAALGNNQTTVVYTDSVEARPTDQIQSLRELTRDMNAGQVDVLVILGGNPVYNAPTDFQFANRLKRVKHSVHVCQQFNETSEKTSWQIPESHFLEEWGDTRAYDGTVTIMQPLIAPLYGTRSALTVLDAMLNFPGRSSYDIVRAFWMQRSGASDFEPWWRKSVHDGLVSGTALLRISPALPSNAIFASRPPKAEGLEIVFRPDVYLYDGRYANNIWLQELPHPMTKLTWDNAVFLSPETAARMGLENQQHVEVRYRGRSVRGSVWILPGHPNDSIGLDLGYGRTHSGRAGNGAGFNAYLLRFSDALCSGCGAEIHKLDTAYPLATTQMQQTMAGRDVVISCTVDDYKHNPELVREKNHPPKENLTLYPHWYYEGYKWGMSIDLTACVNCNACVVACQAENNIPVVGKEQVLARRAMHWLRIDTYYKGDARIPRAVYQPVPCMQCENAPCELVCPVQATNHSRDGLNDMVYNRCVGTRYCSNNCPYKVRRFNFLLFQDWATETYKMQRNPDVTVRSRGVMEKCTYCVQRIREAEIASQLEDRYIKDGEIQTACQQACPTQAIVFGDINNRGNRVAQLKAEKLDYSLLAELNTRPRTTYLAELRNPHPDLPQEASV
jgi:molybdopterin-containing oxidoreductase family iron-sulfur binding subunit